MQEYAIIVAGGKGLRFGGDVPKQFMVLKNLPVLMHAIKAFFHYSSSCKIIVCLPQEHINIWNDLCKTYSFTIPHQVTIGGETRFDSVKNGLDSIKEKDGLVAVHDGVRPLIIPEFIAIGFKKAAEFNSAIPCIALVDSIRKKENGSSQAVDRSLFRAIQTPQCFNLNLLKQAYQQTKNSLFTDDASVYENMGYQVHLIEGDKKNIKITTAEDLAIVETLMSIKNK